MPPIGRAGARGARVLGGEGLAAGAGEGGAAPAEGVQQGLDAGGIGGAQAGQRFRRGGTGRHLRRATIPRRGIAWSTAGQGPPSRVSGVGRLAAGARP